MASSRLKLLLRALEPYGAEKIYLFGSRARGEADALSDIDLVLIKHTRARFFNRLREVQRLLPPDIGAVDVLVYTPAEFAAMLADGNAFAEMLVEEGKLIHGDEAHQ
jgi:predicted nucleotidyltransferase